MTKYLMPVMTALFIGCGLTANAQLVINELMQSNIDCLMDDLKEFPDSWVELYNPSDSPCPLDGYQMGLLPDDSTAWALPSGTLPAHGYLIVFCDREDKGRHTPFRLESGKGGVEAEPVQALRAKATEVLAVALFAVPAVAAHLGEVYLSWYDHV